MNKLLNILFPFVNFILNFLKTFGQKSNSSETTVVPQPQVQQPNPLPTTVQSNSPITTITQPEPVSTPTENKLYKGIDISSVQGSVNFNSVVSSGASFVICKCYTGNDGIDPYYKSNIENASAAGLKTATYNFLYPLQTSTNHPNRDPKGQAQLHFKSCLTSLACADLEWPAPQDWTKWNINAQFINDWTLTYLEEYTKLSGKKPIIYTYPYFCQALKPSDEFAQYPLWIASYEINPTIPHPWTDYVLWQTAVGHLPNGIPVDTDIAKTLDIF